MAESNRTKTIRVHIMGREYGLRVEAGDEAHTRRIAAAVEQRMERFKKAHPDQAELTTAVMTALSFAEELSLHKEDHEEGTNALNNELETLVDKLDGALPPTEPAEEA